MLWWLCGISATSSMTSLLQVLPSLLHSIEMAVVWDTLHWPFRIVWTILTQGLSCLSVAGLNTMAVEPQFPRDRGLSDLVILSFLRTRKLTSCKFFHRTWMASFALCEARKFNTWKISKGCILSFLQHQSVCTIKGKSQPWPCHLRDWWPLFPYLKPLYRVSHTLWDLLAFQWPPFKPIRDIL